MKSMFVVLAMIVSLVLGCAPSDQAPPVVEATPTATAAEEQITEMDFESGEAEETVEPAEAESEQPE